MPTLWIIVGILNLLGAGYSLFSGSLTLCLWSLGGALAAFTVACIIHELRGIREAIERSAGHADARRVAELRKQDQQRKASGDVSAGPRWVSSKPE